MASYTLPKSARERYREDSRPKLEDTTIIADPTVLSDDQELHRTNGGRTIRDKSASSTSSHETASEDPKFAAGRKGIVPTITLGPEEYATAEYKLPKRGTVQLDLDANRPVKTYIVGPKSLARFEEGSRTFMYWGGFPDPRDSQHHTFVVPFSGPVLLLIVNPSRQQSVDVEYDLSF